mmetsp:Transcript_115017/g.200142  ORF Transcript_115017/g.200142 Transcript_115017/m.200142 type:complete len:272 (-) Transcript_115017:1163-1978(-)
MTFWRWNHFPNKIDRGEEDCDVAIPGVGAVLAGAHLPYLPVTCAEDVEERANGKEYGIRGTKRRSHLAIEVADDAVLHAPRRAQDDVPDEVCLAECEEVLLPVDGAGCQALNFAVCTDLDNLLAGDMVPQDAFFGGREHVLTVRLERPRAGGEGAQFLFLAGFVRVREAGHTVPQALAGQVHLPLVHPHEAHSAPEPRVHLLRLCGVRLEAVVPAGADQIVGRPVQRVPHPRQGPYIGRHGPQRSSKHCVLQAGGVSVEARTLISEEVDGI